MSDGPVQQEMVEVLDRSGAIVDVVPRSIMRARNLPHRSSYVVVLRVDGQGWTSQPGDIDANGDIDSWVASSTWTTGVNPHQPILDSLKALVTPSTPVIVHQRADWKDVYPSYWDLGFGGVCSAGEPWLASARRELSEEAGITDVAVRPIGHGHFADDSGSVFGVVFAAATTRPPIITDGEVVVLDEVAIRDLEAWTADRPVCPDSLAMALPLVKALLIDR